jgi:hypothetical protein
LFFAFLSGEVGMGEEGGRGTEGKSLFILSNKKYGLHLLS